MLSSRGDVPAAAGVARLPFASIAPPRDVPVIPSGRLTKLPLRTGVLNGEVSDVVAMLWLLATPPPLPPRDVACVALAATTARGGVARGAGCCLGSFGAPDEEEGIGFGNGDGFFVEFAEACCCGGCCFLLLFVRAARSSPAW